MKRFRVRKRVICFGTFKFDQLKQRDDEIDNQDHVYTSVP